MNSHASTSRYILTALSIILVITAFILVGLNALEIQKGGSLFSFGAPSQAQLKYRAGYLAARAREQTLFPAIAMPITILNGTITNLTSDGFIINATNVDTNKIADGLDTRRNVKLTSTTVIQKVISKSPKDFAKELAAGVKLDKTLPRPFTTQTIRASNLSVGENVTVMISKDARTNGTVTALTINIR